MAEDYKISLGVDLDTSDLKGKIEALDNKHSIKLGVDLKVNDIRDRITAYNKNTNNAKLKLGISLDTSDLKSQIKELNLNSGNSKGKGKGVAIPINTASLETSLKEVKGIIADIKNSLGTLDNGNTKSLVSSVNQIASALERATNESDGLLASLNALSKKDFSVGIDVKLGGTNNSPVSNNVAYGNFVRGSVIPQLQKQANDLMKVIRDEYSKRYSKEYFDFQSDDFILEKLSNRNFHTPVKSIGSLQKEILDDKNLSKQMTSYSEYIDAIEGIAKAANIDISSVASGFSKTKDELIQSALDIQTGVRTAAESTEESVEKFKKLFNGGIDADGLGQVLEPLLDDIREIRRAFESLSSIGTIDGLTASFKELSEVLEKLTSNIIVVKNALDNSFSNATIVNNVPDKIEQESDTTTAAVIQNEKKKQEAYKATADAVVYHAGIISKLNKAETNGRFYGSKRGTGYFGTGHYFVDANTKHELDNNSNYNKLPYTSVDISQYNNLFKATTDEIADGLHSFLANLTAFTQGSDNYDISELFEQFKKVFGNTIMDVKEFGSRLDQLKTFMSNSSMDDRSDSVSTQFMKSLGYEGVDTRGTKYADTRYGTVIYDLKEESVLQANITDELQKQGQMLEKINYERGQVFDKSEDDRIQSILDAQNKKREINEEFKNSFDSANFDKANSDLISAENRLKEIDNIIADLTNGINNAEQEAKKFAREMESFGLDMSDEEIQDHMQGVIKNYNESIDQLTKEKAELQSKIPVLEEVYDRESQLANEAYEKAKQTVEQRYLEQQQAQESANAVIRNEERKQQAYQKTANTINQIDGFESAQEELKNLNFNTKSLDSMINDFNNLGIQVKEISHILNKDGSITFNVNGVDKLGNAVKAIKTLDSSGNFKSFSSSISQSLEDSDRFIKQQKQAVSNLTNQINQLNRAANDQNASRPIKDSAHLDTLSSKYNEVTSAIQRMEAASSDTFIDEQNNVKKLISEYKSLVSEIRNAENVATSLRSKDIDTVKDTYASKLDVLISKMKKDGIYTSGFENGAENLRNILTGATDASGLTKFLNGLDKLEAGYKRASASVKEFNQSQKVGINVSGLESKIADLQRISPEIDKFEVEINGAKVTVQSLLNDLKQVNTQGDFSVVNSRFKAFTDAAKSAGIAVTEVVEKVKSVKDIKLDVELGTYDNQISQMDDKFNRLSSASKELYESVEQVHQAYTRMELALESTGDEVVDKERLIQAEKEYARALEKTNNLIRIQSRQDKADNDRLKLNDDINVFQSKIDAWLTKNSAATKQFGAAMLDLKAKAEGVDRVNLNHLEKEFKQLDYAAEQAGLKVQSTFDRVKGKFKEYMAYFSVAEVFMYVEQGLREMFNTVKEIDTAMTGLYRVTDLTASEYDTLFNNMINSAKEYGATLNDIINATTDWVRAGFDADTALGLAEVTTMYQHISDLDYDIAAENLITAYNGFKDELNTAFDGDTVGAVNYIADIFNELDNNFAVTSAGLGEALTRSASALDLAGNTIQETAG